jgi:hypothetical protein
MIEAMKAIKMVYANTTKHDWPDDIWDVICKAIEAEKQEPVEEKQTSVSEVEPVTWGVDWGKAGDTPCVSIIKRLLDGRIEVVAVEYAPYTNPYTGQPKQEPLGEEFSRILHENLWDLYER